MEQKPLAHAMYYIVYLLVLRTTVRDPWRGGAREELGSGKGHRALGLAKPVMMPKA